MAKGERNIEKGARNNKSKTTDFGIRDKRCTFLSGIYTEEKRTRAEAMNS
jgi:hypothetical protein